MSEIVKLPPKQEIFALAVFQGDSQRKAYIKAYPKSEKWQDKTKDSKASTLANTEKVKARLAQLRDNAAEKATITLDQVLQEIGKVAFIQEADFYNQDGSCKLASELTDEQRAALKSYTVKSVPIGDGEYVYVPVFVVHDKLKGLDMLMKNLGGYEKDNKTELHAYVEEYTKLPKRDESK